MARLPPEVPVPTELRDSFCGLRGIPCYEFSRVKVVTAPGRTQVRVIVVTREQFFVARLNGKIERCVQLQSIVQLWQHEHNLVIKAGLDTWLVFGGVAATDHLCSVLHTLAALRETHFTFFKRATPFDPFNLQLSKSGYLVHTAPISIAMDPLRLPHCVHTPRSSLKLINERFALKKAKSVDIVVPGGRCSGGESADDDDDGASSSDTSSAGSASDGGLRGGNAFSSPGGGGGAFNLASPAKPLAVGASGGDRDRASPTARIKKRLGAAAGTSGPAALSPLLRSTSPVRNAFAQGGGYPTPPPAAAAAAKAKAAAAHPASSSSASKSQTYPGKKTSGARQSAFDWAPLAPPSDQVGGASRRPAEFAGARAGSSGGGGGGKGYVDVAVPSSFSKGCRMVSVPTGALRAVQGLVEEIDEARETLDHFRNRRGGSPVWPSTGVLKSPPRLSPPANAVKKAAETEGGAATKYEAVKRRTYDGPILEQQDLLLVPMVVDTFGAWGESALQGDPLGPLLFSLALHDVVVPPSPEEQPPVPAALASSQAPADSALATPARDSGQPEPPDAIGGQPTPSVPAQAPGSGDPAASPPPAGSSATRGAPEGALGQAELDLLTFFLDDGAAGGELDSLGRWLRDFEDRATAVGLSLNRGKCRLSVAPGATIPEALQGIETCPLDEIQHLGVPCGSPEKMRVFVEEAAKGAERKMRMIASLPDAHVALTLLKFCAGFVSVVPHARLGSFDFAHRSHAVLWPSYRDGLVGASVRQAVASCRHGEPSLSLATITGIETDASAWALASLPVRLGGLGLHSCADTAAIAHIAATFDGEACLSSLVTPYVLPHAMLLDEDDTFLASLEDPRLAPFDSVLEKIQDVLQARDNYGGRGQKVWSATVHDERRKALIDAMTEELGRSGQPALALKQVQIRARIQRPTCVRVALRQR
ncbi:hypothetical protein DIPPA_33426 [Diplonema papillatum]|nr:hypothetical protein DIPPA_33426 [Diplonema papillatum]